VQYPLEHIDEMYREGLEMKRQQLRRASPSADDAQIERLLRAWIDERPVDAPGCTPRA